MRVHWTRLSLEHLEINESEFLTAMELTTGGWIIMLFSVGLTTGGLVWCISKVLSKPNLGEQIHPPLDVGVETGDRDRD